MILLKVNYLEDCTVFEVINFSDFMFGFLSVLLWGVLSWTTTLIPTWVMRLPVGG